MRVLVTGVAGFIGFHVARALIARGDAVTGFDNVNDYYDPGLKEARLAELKKLGGDWRFRRADLADRAAVETAFETPFDRVIHLAAQAGVRHSLEHPLAYVESNVTGFAHVLEACRHARTPHLTFASTSSVYGANTTMPFTEGQGVDHPLQFYAATKRAGELMAHAYAHLYRLPCTGLRFFTVYGPWGRPDMAPMIFARAIVTGRPLKLFNEGRHSRDFTYVDDIVDGVVRASDQIAAPDPDWDAGSPDPATSNAPFRLYNIGNNAPVELADFVAALEAALGRTAVRELLPLQPGDVPDTWADSSRLIAATGWRPTTPVEEGVRRFVDWYRDYVAERRRARRAKAPAPRRPALARPGLARPAPARSTPARPASRRPATATRRAAAARQILFIIGVARSGTTAMADLLNLHPAICIGIERYKFKFVRRAEFDAADFAPERFFDFRRDDTNILPRGPGRWKGVYARMRRKFPRAKVVGDKIPHLFERFEECTRTFPQAKWIYMLRGIDGVASSWNARAQNPGDKWPAKNDFRAAVETWNHANALIRALPEDRLRIVAYEDFFGGDEAARRALLGFIGVGEGPGFVRNAAISCQKYAEVVQAKAPLVLDGQEAHLAAYADMETYRVLLARARDAAGGAS